MILGEDEMANEKQDRRVRYTKMVLRESLLELLKTAPINKITVKDVCERADVNRGTFYAHYRDTYDLMEQIVNELIETIRTALSRHDGRHDSTRAVIAEILNCITENSELCAILLAGGDSTFIQRVSDLAREQFEEIWGRIGRQDAKDMIYVNTFIVSGSIGVIRQWIESGMHEDCEKIAEVVENMTYRGLASYG